MIPFLCVIAVSFVALVLLHPLFTPFGITEEQINYYAAARNFVTFGWLRSGLLQDLSTSSQVGQHPYLYGHVPPGPEITTALLISVVGERWRVIRLAFAVVFALGLWTFLCFVRLLLRTHDLPRVEWYAFPLLGIGLTMTLAEHPGHALLPLLFCGPILCMVMRRRGWRLVGLGLVLLATQYLVPPSLLLMLACWWGLALFGLARLTVRNAGWLTAVAIIGVLAHLIHVALVIGLSVFASDLLLTLSNRITGYPSYQDVHAFFVANNLVLHGRHTLSFDRVLAAGWKLLLFPGRKYLLLAVALSLGATMTWRARDVLVTTPAVRLALRIIAWAAITVWTPLVLLPAYAAEYSIPGRDLIIAAASTMLGALALKHVSVGGDWQHQLLRAVVVPTLGLAAMTSASTPRSPWEPDLGSALRAPMTLNDALLTLGRHLNGAVVATNSYPTLIGFISRESVFGLCEDRAVLKDGTLNLEECANTYLRSDVRPWPRPAYFVVSTMTAGFASCTSTCLDAMTARLKDAYPIAAEMPSRSFIVFDLSRRRQAGTGHVTQPNRDEAKVASQLPD